MESIGEFFRQVRETKGLTIDEVASKTRIRTDFVKALEDGNFAKLPDQVFARGFVRSYARSLGLDEDDAIHRFDQSAGAYYDKHVERERLRVRQAEEERKQKANRKAVAIAIGIAIITLIFLLSREQSSLLVRRSSSDIPTSPAKRMPPPIPEAQDAPPSQTAEAVPVAPKAKSSESPVVSAEPGAKKNCRTSDQSHRYRLGCAGTSGFESFIAGKRRAAWRNFTRRVWRSHRGTVGA